MSADYIVSKARGPGGRLLVLGSRSRTVSNHVVSVDYLDLGNAVQRWVRERHPSDANAFVLKNVGLDQWLFIGREDPNMPRHSRIRSALLTWNPPGQPYSAGMYWYDDRVPGPYNALASRDDREIKLNIMGDPGTYSQGTNVIGFKWDGGAVNELWRSWPQIRVPAVGDRVLLTNFEFIVQLGARPDGSIYMHTNRDAWERWTVEDAGGGARFLRSAHGTYLGSRGDGSVYVTQNRDAWERWVVFFDDGIRLRSAQWGLHLGSRPDGSIYTHANCREWERWWTPAS